MAKYGPQYLNCNERQTSCTRRKAQPRLGCPNCEFTIQYNFFRVELEHELSLLAKGTRYGARQWPSKKLIELVTEIASISHQAKEERDKNWTVVISLLVSVYRDEYAKKKAIDDHASYVPESEGEKPKGRSLPVPKQDEGDFD